MGTGKALVRLSGGGVLSERWVRWSLAAFVISTFSVLLWPQTGDGALFQTAARILGEGGAYWRDFWDYKQPGLYWWYAIADNFHHGLIAARLLEIVTLDACAVLSAMVADRVVGDARVTASAPWLVVGPYAFGSVVGGVGQVEGLMALPVLLMIAATIDLTGHEPRPFWALIGGVAAGVLVLLKVLYAPIALCIVLLGLASCLRPAGERGRVCRMVRWWLGGFALVIVAASTELIRTNAWNVAWLTTFEFPGRVLQPSLFEPSRIGWVLQKMIPYYVPLIVLSLPALAAARHREARVERAALLLVMVTLVNILPQLPTTYRLLALSVPMGCLAALGLARILASGRVRGLGVLTVAMAVVAAALVVGYQGLRVAAAAQRVGFPTDEAGLYAIGDRLMGDDMNQWRCPVVGRIARDTPIVVVGDPRVFRAVDARPAMEVHGWSVEMYDAILWAEFTREFERSRPAWVFVDDFYRAELDRGAPRVRAILNSTYEQMAPCQGSNQGSWYRGREQPGPSTPHADGVRFEE